MQEAQECKLARNPKSLFGSSIAQDIISPLPLFGYQQIE
jgi:hypothetical protein